MKKILTMLLIVVSVQCIAQNCKLSRQILLDSNYISDGYTHDIRLEKNDTFKIFKPLFKLKEYQFKVKTLGIDSLKVVIKTGNNNAELLLIAETSQENYTWNYLNMEQNLNLVILIM